MTGVFTAWDLFLNGQYGSDHGSDFEPERHVGLAVHILVHCMCKLYVGAVNLFEVDMNLHFLAYLKEAVTITGNCLNGCHSSVNDLVAVDA